MLFTFFLLPTAHNHTKRIVVSEGACRVAHHSCADVSGICYAHEALTKHKVHTPFTHRVKTDKQVKYASAYVSWLSVTQSNKSNHLQ